MRLIVFSFFLFCSLGSIIAQTNANQDLTKKIKEGTHFEFDKTYLDLGDVKKGEKRNFNYLFKNTGTETIKISYFSYCDCTTLKYPAHKTILPGDSMTIEVEFDSATKDKEETIDIEMELENIEPDSGLPYFIVLKYHFVITN